MPGELQAGPVSLVQLLKGEKQYISPLFQRKYVWEKKHLDDLWNDIDAIYQDVEEARFLGAVVFVTQSAGLAFQPDSTWIVDGQQRLTTLYTILLGFAAEAEKNDCTSLCESLYRQYLLNQDGKYKNSPKVTPTLVDFCQFNSLFKHIQMIRPQLNADFGPTLGTLAEANKLIQKAIRQRCYDNIQFNEDVAKRYVSIILEKLRVVAIWLGEKQDPHQVFNSLNSQGVRLENKDLIRNIVFQRIAHDPEEADHIYRTKWLPLELELDERFDGYFFPFALVHKPTVTKSNLLHSLQLRWHDFDPSQIMDDLHRFVPIYNALTASVPDARSQLCDSIQICECFERFYRMNVPSTIYSFIFSIMDSYFHSGLSETDVTANCSQIEAFLVRRSLAGYEPTGLHAVFKDLFNRTHGDPTRMIEEIDNNPTVHFPDDEEFLLNILERPLYGRRLAKYILLEYERALEGGDPSDMLDCTIDHVMPQELTDAWRADVSEETHKKVKDTWANLVPLTGPANSEKGRKPWSEAREYFLTETKFKTTKRLAHDHNVWNSDTIRKRGEQIGSWALGRWPKKLRG